MVIDKFVHMKDCVIIMELINVVHFMFLALRTI